MRAKYKRKADCRIHNHRGLSSGNNQKSIVDDFQTETDVVSESFVQALGKNVSVTYQPRTNKTGIKKIVLSDCKTTFPQKQITIKIEKENLSFPMKTTTKRMHFSDVPRPTTTSKPTTAADITEIGEATELH